MRDSMILTIRKSQKAKQKRDRLKARARSEEQAGPRLPHPAKIDHFED
jgi:hypothetical protein